MIVLAENKVSPLFANKERSIVDQAYISDELKAQYENSEMFNKIGGLPHSVIGPHFDEINPLLSQESQNQIDLIMQYTEEDWQTLSQYVAEHNMPVGNSTAANLACAVTLANR